MPHIIVEYNPVVEKYFEVDGLVAALHCEAIEIDALPTGGIRTRAVRSSCDRVGDGDAANGFIYITVRIGQGRSVSIKKDIGDTLFGVLTNFTDASFKHETPLSLGLEIQEIEKEWTWKKNNIHQIIKDKNNGSN